MIEVTLEELEKKFESLPEDLKWAIMGADVDAKIIDIGQKHALNVEQMGQLALETHAVMFGYTHPDKFEESVQASMQLPRDETTEIVKEVNEKVLKGVRDQFMSLYEERSPFAKKKEEEINKTPEVPTSIPENKNIPPVEKETDLEIMPPELPAGEEKSKETFGNTPTGSVFAQKFSETFHAPSVKTEHSLPSVGGDKNPSAPGEAKDPYREIPE